MLGGAVGQGVGLTQFGLGGQAGLASGLSADQMMALGMVPDLSGLPMRDMAAAFGPNFQLDQLANQRQQQGQANSRYQQQLPWQNLMMYSDIINSMSGGYGTSSGLDQRGQQPYASNPWTQAALGGLAGWFSGGQNAGA
jgi:hypothetical protein